MGWQHLSAVLFTRSRSLAAARLPTRHSAQMPRWSPWNSLNIQRSQGSAAGACSARPQPAELADHMPITSGGSLLTLLPLPPKANAWHFPPHPLAPMHLLLLLCCALMAPLATPSGYPSCCCCFCTLMATDTRCFCATLMRPMLHHHPPTCCTLMPPMLLPLHSQACAPSAQAGVTSGAVRHLPASRQVCLLHPR